VIAYGLTYWEPDRGRYQGPKGRRTRTDPLPLSSRLRVLMPFESTSALVLSLLVISCP